MEVEQGHSPEASKETHKSTFGAKKDRLSPFYIFFVFKRRQQSPWNHGIWQAAKHPHARA